MTAPKSKRGGKRAGAGAKPLYSEPMHPITVRLPDEAHALLDTLQAHYGCSASAVVRRALVELARTVEGDARDEPR